MKLIVASCIYNEEQFIMDMINSLKLIQDIDAIHIHDGPWRRGGDFKGKSTDNTAEIITKYQRENNLQEFIYFTERTLPTPWDSEPNKRNHQLDMISHWYSPQDDDVYILWIDGDEEFVTDGKPIKLKPYLHQLADYYTMESGPKGELDLPNDPMHTQVRIFKANRGIHWHTEKPNCLHDAQCNVISDHDYGIIPENAIKLPFEIMNKWLLRDEKRQKEKEVYFSFIRGRKDIPPCLLKQ